MFRSSESKAFLANTTPDAMQWLTIELNSLATDCQSDSAWSSNSSISHSVDCGYIYWAASLTKVRPPNLSSSETWNTYPNQFKSKEEDETQRVSRFISNDFRTQFNINQPLVLRLWLIGGDGSSSIAAVKFSEALLEWFPLKIFIVWDWFGRSRGYSNIKWIVNYVVDGIYGVGVPRELNGRKLNMVVAPMIERLKLYDVSN